MNEQTAVATHEPLPEMRAIIAPPGNFSAYMGKLLRTAAEGIEDAERRIAKAEMWEDSDAIREAEQGIEAAKRLDGDEGESQLHRWTRELVTRQRSKKVRLARLRHQLQSALAFRDALQLGYVPLPAMPAVSLDRCYQTMPPDVIDAFAEAKEVGVFEEFRIIDGRDANRYGWPTGGRGAAKQDPILIGMIAGEMFAIAWWR